MASSFRIFDTPTFIPSKAQKREPTGSLFHILIFQQILQESIEFIIQSLEQFPA